MGNIISIRQMSQLADHLKKQQKTTVLVGGCFDVLHPGHVIFLEKAKAVGDMLVVLLESDQKIKKLKGVNRPVHNQNERAKVLSALKSVDHIVMLPFINKESEYDQIVNAIKPNIIAVTRGHINSYHHQRSAKLIDAKLKYVTKMIGNYSTSNILSK